LDRRRQHRARRRLAHQQVEPLHEPIEAFAGHAYRQARTGAELPHAEQHRILQPIDDGISALFQGAGQDKDRIDAAHLCIDWNRLRANRRRIEERAAGMQTSREAHSFEMRMLDERPCDLVPCAVQHRKDAARDLRLVCGRDDGPCRQCGRGWMCRMRLDDNGTSGGESGGGVSPGNGECQRKVARAEDGDWPDGHEHATYVRFRERAALRLCAVDAGVDPRSVPHQGCEQAQLIGRTGALARETLCGERRLGVRRVDQGIVCFDGSGDAIEEDRAVLGADAAIRRE
jgi:hypothetical protein